MATKPIGQAEFERALMQIAPAQGELLPGQRAPGVTYTGKPGRPKGRRNNKTLFRLANIDNLGEEMLRRRMSDAMLDPVDAAKRTVARIYHLPENADPNTIIDRRIGKDGVELQIVTFADAVTQFTIEYAKLREKAREGVSPFVLKKKPTEIDLTEKKITEVRFIAEDRRQLPQAMQGMVVDAVAEVITDTKEGKP